MEGKGEAFSSGFSLTVNGQLKDVMNPDPGASLLGYLRSSGLSSVKRSCSEGGCGACTVVVSDYDAETEQVRHRAINSCLFRLCAAEGMHVLTSEALGSVSAANIHPLQERLAVTGGSQCGYCSPAIVMNIYAMLSQSNEPPTADLIERTLEGNICRCTGYRPIADAFLPLSQPSSWKELWSSPNASRSALEFPASLKHPVKPAHFLRTDRLRDSTHWFRPTTLSDLLRIKAAHPDALIVGGGTVTLDRKKSIITTTAVNEMRMIKREQQGLRIGAAVSMSTLLTYLQENMHLWSKCESASFQCLKEQLLLFTGGPQILNMATLGGNVMKRFPGSSILPVLLCWKATLSLATTMTNMRTTEYEHFHPQPHEVLVSIFLPCSQSDHVWATYRQPHPTTWYGVSAALCVRLSSKNISKTVTEARLCYGGFEHGCVKCVATETMLVGKSWDAATQALAIASLKKEPSLQLSDSSSGGNPSVRTKLAQNFFLKFFLHTTSSLDKRDKSSLSSSSSTLSSFSSSQVFQEAKGTEPVGQSLIHVNARKQVTGEALYVNDTPEAFHAMQSVLSACPVLSTVAHGKVVSVDVSAALSLPGVRAYIDHKDVPGSNAAGFAHDEELFATTTVHCVGTMLGLIIADTFALAEQAASLVVVKYQELPAIFSIQEAIAANSYLGPAQRLVQGDVEKALASSKHIVEGEVSVGGQYHYYLETQNCVVTPGEEIVVVSATQHPRGVQDHVAEALGISRNQVVVRTPRLGGGFGGKETRAATLAQACAVAANKLRQTVRIVLSRKVDMAMVGSRHPFFGQWKVGLDESGKLTAVDIKLYANGGCSEDMSLRVLSRAIFHVDNTYSVPHFRVVGLACRTNLPSNTAFRGFGAPQGMFFTEAFMDQAASQIGIPPHVLRERNLYSEGEKVPCGITLTGCEVRRVWSNLMSSSDFLSRQKAVEKFNSENHYVKRGIAIIPTKYGIGWSSPVLHQAQALVHIYTDGSVLLTHGGVEMGQGLHTKMCQVAAQALGCDLSYVLISNTATDKVPNTSLSGSSLTADLNGMAVLDACTQLHTRLSPLKTEGLSWPELCKKAYTQRINLCANGFFGDHPNTAFNFETQKGEPFLYFTYGGAVAEVEVDCLTGYSAVLRVDMVLDCGRSLNPGLDIGQAEGGYMQGFGLFCQEEVIAGDNDHNKWLKPGEPYTVGPSTYKVPLFSNLPRDFRCALLENSTNQYVRSVHSSKGVGEPPVFLGASVHFAVRAAVSAYLKEHCPASPPYPNMDSPCTWSRIVAACEPSIKAI